MTTLYYVVRKSDDGFDIIIPMMSMLAADKEYTPNIAKAMYLLDTMQKSFSDFVYELKQIES